MKKIIHLLISFFSLFLLMIISACGSNEISSEEKYYSNLIENVSAEFIDYDAYKNYQREIVVDKDDYKSTLLGNKSCFLVTFDINKIDLSNVIGDMFTINVYYEGMLCEAENANTSFVSLKNNSIAINYSYLLTEETKKEKILFITEIYKDASIRIEYSKKVLYQVDLYYYSDYEFELIGDHELEIVKYRGMNQNVEIPEKVGLYTISKISQEAFEGKNIEYLKEDGLAYLGNKTNPYLLLADVLDTELVDYVVNKDTQFYYPNIFKNCNKLNSISLNENLKDIVNTLNHEEKEGYEYLGIKQESTGAITKYSFSYEPIEYSISYNLNGGTNDENNPTSYNIETETIDLANPSKVGYVFEGWEEGRKIISGSTGNKTFTAIYSIINYNIYYELSGGENDEDNPTSYNIDSEGIVLKAPTRKGYIFNGWFIEDEKIESINSESLTDLTLEARWTAKEYNIEVNPDGGDYDGVTSFTITFDSEVNLPSPKKFGLSFIGWYYYDEEVLRYWNIDSESTITIVAKYENAISKYLTYERVDSGNKYSITGLNSGYDSEVAIIPSTIGDINIVGISSKAFYQNNKITYLAIPSSVTSIATYALAEMTSLETLILPNSITTFGDYAFKGDSAIKSFTIPSDLKSVGKNVLVGCTSLATLNTTLSSSYTISSFFTSIKGSYDSQNISFPSSLTTINVTSGNVIPSNFFAALPATITNINFNSMVTEVGYQAFYGAACGLIIPPSVQKIGEYAYACLGTIDSMVTLPSGLREIGSLAFYGTYFPSISLPGSLTKIGGRIFMASSKNTMLKTIYYNGTKEKLLSIATIGGYDSFTYGLSSYTIYCSDATYTYSTTSGSWK